MKRSRLMPRSAGHFSYLNEMKKCLQIVLAGLVISVAAACGNRNDERNPAAPSNADPQPAWALLPFEKIDSVNPVLNPGDGVFFCPVRRDTVRWEEKDV